MNMSKAGVPIEWLLTGKKIEEETTSNLPVIRRAHRPLDLTPPSAEVAGIIGKTWSILESQTSTAQALELNVCELYEKVFGSEDKREGSGGVPAGPAGGKNAAGGA